jgi:excisionase family DNA binding protein
VTAPRVYTVDEAAEILHVTRDWLARRLNEKKLPGRKFGRRWLLTDADLQAALDNAYSAPTTPRPDPSGLSPRSRKAQRRKAS